ncbi:MAG: putative transrane protein [Rhodoferax sp.]|nr:putative transrane protein [Rhodoferax sp.]
MSTGGFHVHGPHDHELEHAGAHGDADSAHDSRESGRGSMTNQIAVCTAVIATVGAIFAYMGGLTQANAGLYKNNAGMKKTEASNQWNYFQSKSTKQALAEFAMETSPDDRKLGWQTKVARYEQEKAEILLVAQKLEADATDWDQKSEAQMHLHHRWAQATTALQVSIALAAMALLTRKKWLEWGMLAVAGVGLVVGALAALHT